MPRKLPWKVYGDGAQQATTTSTTIPTSGHLSAPRLPTTSGGLADLKGPVGQACQSRARSPSTSPPPVPQEESFMIDGLDADDGYRMVEDEFLSVAGTFTAHLHKAEYHRLKSLAKDKNAMAIRAISRPVTGGQTEAVKRGQTVLKLAARQTAGIKRAQGEIASDKNGDQSDDDGLENPWTGTALQGLMDNTRQTAVPLSAIMRSKSAAATTAQRDRDIGSSSSAIRRPEGMASGPPPSHPQSHSRRHVSSDDHGGGNDDLPQTDDEGDDDLEASSSFTARQHNNLQCHRPVPEAKARETRPTPHLTPHPRPFDSASDSTSLQMHRTRHTASTNGNGDVVTPGRGAASTPLLREALPSTAVRSAGVSGVRKPSRESGDDSDDSAILRRIRARRKSRMAQSGKEAEHEASKMRVDRHKQAAAEEKQDASLDLIPSFL